MSLAQVFAGLRALLQEARQKDKQIADGLNTSEKGRVERRISQVARIMEETAFKPASLVDIGCGNGRITAAMAKAFNLPKDAAIGIDLFPPKTANVGFKFIRQTGSRLPFQNNSVDLVTLFAVLHHADNPLALLKEVHRILKEKGCLIVREFDATDGEIYDFNLVMDHLMYEVFDEAPEMPIPGHYLSLDTWRELFDKAGFSVERTDRPEPANPFNPFLSLLKKKRALPEA